MLFSTEVALLHWESEYKKIFFDPNAGIIDVEVNKNDKNEILNLPISMDEVRKSVDNLKTGKGVGIDCIPNEAFKNEIMINILHTLFSICFEYNIIPSKWKDTIICPIPKGDKSRPTDPLSYRGLSLQCCMYKIYSKIMNIRLNSYLNDNNILSESQNGFRSKRSTIEHVFTLTEGVECYYKKHKQPVYVCFVDFSKAFDSVNRSILMKRLQEIGVNGKYLDHLVSSYQESNYIINVSGNKTNKIKSNRGVKQGDHESPSLFNIFLDPIIRQIDSQRLGIALSEDIILSILAYADDLVLIAPNKLQLQQQLNILYKWCEQNGIAINVSKTNYMVLKGKKNATDCLTIGGSELEYVDSYKYLGVWIDSNLNYKKCAECLYRSSSRALGAMISKIKNYNDLGYAGFTKLYNSLVVPIEDYGCEIWNINMHKEIIDIQNRAMRYFLGVHKYTPILGLQGEMQWESVKNRQNIAMLRMYNRICKMSSERLPKIVFKISLLQNTKWLTKLKEIVNRYCGDGVVLSNMNKININLVKARMLHCDHEQWSQDVKLKPKLNIYKKIKLNSKPSSHLFLRMSKYRRSIITQLRLGILPLRVETGRFLQERHSERICKLCDLNKVEDELHFLKDCKLYSELRQELSGKLGYCLNDTKDCLNLLTNLPIPFIKYVENCWNLRKAEVKI